MWNLQPIVFNNPLSTLHIMLQIDIQDLCFSLGQRDSVLYMNSRFLNRRMSTACHFAQLATNKVRVRNWSLLAFSRPDESLYSLDSAGNFNKKSSSMLYDKLKVTLSSPNETSNAVCAAAHSVIKRCATLLS